MVEQTEIIIRFRSGAAENRKDYAWAGRPRYGFRGLPSRNLDRQLMVMSIGHLPTTQRAGATISKTNFARVLAVNRAAFHRETAGTPLDHYGPV